MERDTRHIQYCAKVMQTKFDEFRSLFSQTFERNFTQFRAKSIALKRYFDRTIFRKVKQKIPIAQKLAEAKIRAATVNKNLSDSEVVIHIASDNSRKVSPNA